MASVLLYQMACLVLYTGVASAAPPSYTLPTYVSKYENLPNGSELFNFMMYGSGTVKVSATPSDLISVSPSSSVTPFSVSVTLKSPLDREAASSHTLRFLATDGDGNEIRHSLKLYVSDVNDNPPSFVNIPYFWDIPELPCDISIFYTKIKANDPDSGENGTVTYSFTPNTQSIDTSLDYLKTFDFNNETGTITLKKCLDYVENSYYQFTVSAKDKGSQSLSSNVSLIIRVKDVQNQPPFFTGVPYRTPILEGTPPNVHVIKVTARDGDTGVSNQVTYTISGGSCNDSFKINTDNGQISTSKQLDRDSGSIMEVDGVCVLTILVMEINGSQPQYGNMTSTTDVTITVNDVNDNSPSFNTTTYLTRIQENAQQNVPLVLLDPRQILVFDMDQGDNSAMDISLEWANGTTCDYFKVSPNLVRQSGSLIIQVEDQSILDFEVTQHLEFFIVATEQANASHVAKATVILNITDENDNSPQFNERNYVFNIFEGPPNGTSVGNITATDADSGDYKLVTYSLLGSEHKFNINNMTGEITTVCEPKELDRETIGIYYLTVTATDNKGQGRSNSTSVKIELLDVNDNTPVFLRDVYQEFVKENEEYQTKAVLTVVAQDSDEQNTTNSMIEYFMDASSSSWISSNVTINTTGEIYFRFPIDYEKLPDKDTGKFNFTVYARDLGSPQRTGNATVEITVEDVNDNTPMFNMTSYEADVQENATSTVNSLFSVLNVSAVDMDGSERNNRFQYFINDGARNRFAVDPETGNVYVQRNAELDRETDSEYNITMLAIDLGSDARTGTTEVIITVTDVNDERPEFNSSTCNTASLLENTTSDTVVTKCEATDPDLAHNLYYNITNIHATDEHGKVVTGEQIQDFFKINTTSGTVLVKDKLDRETAETIELTILVEDLNAELNAPQNDTKILTITLLDINDNDPEFSPYNYTMSVSENALDSTRLDAVQATDADKNRTITYSINHGESPTESFTVGNDTGIITKVGSIDRELNSTILLYVTATDNGVPSRHNTTTVLIDVIDYNDNSPIFYLNSTNQYIDVHENVTNDTLVFAIRAYDIDDGPNAVVTYGFESGADGHFRIDKETGDIYTASTLDRETRPSYTIRINARDNSTVPSERRSNQTILTINLLDVNDNAPIFMPKIHNLEVIETDSVNTVIATITASDSDVGDNKQLTYSFLNDTEPPGLFAVRETTGEIRVNSSLRTHVGSYVIELMAEDGGVPSLNGSTLVNITITDVNIHEPVIDNLPENDTIRVYECFRVGTVIYTFNYTDGDQGQNANAYFNISAIDNDNVLDKFSINEAGDLKVKSKLDANEASTYRFQIQATDRGMPSPLSSEKHTLFIHVIDVNNYLPGFTSDVAQFSVKENEPNVTSVGTVTAVDDDKDSVTCYNISEQLDASLFDIERTTGTIRTKRSFDREVDGNELHIIVMVHDCTVSDHSCGNDSAPPVQKYRTNITVTVRVDDVDDNPPVFLYDEISVGMRRNEEVNFVLDLDLKNGGYVLDNDTDRYGKQSWVFANNGTASLSAGLSSLVEPETGVSECSATGSKNLFCITGNGTIVNNKYFNEDMSGYILLPVSVRDGSGSDQSILKIYLISDSQVLIMTIFDVKEKVATYKDTLLELYSNITKYTFIYDGLQDHKTSTSIDTTRSDLYFHIVDPTTQRILPADEAQRLVDSFYDLLRDATAEYKVLQVLASTAGPDEVEDDPMRTVYILVAVVVLLVLTVVVIVYVSLTLRSRYQRKIKALSVDKVAIAKEESTTVIPGSNHYSKMSNPLLNANIIPAPEYDNLSLSSNNSIDMNEVGTPREDTVYDDMEVKEKTMQLYMENPNFDQMESPLDAALRMHDMNKASERRGDETYVEDDDEVDFDQVVIEGFVNETFEMESSEI